MTTEANETAQPKSQSNGRRPTETNPKPSSDSPKAPALPLDLCALSDEALAALAEAAPREIERRKTEREEAFFASIRESAATLGIPPARLMAALGAKSARQRSAPNSSKDGRSSVKPKFRDPRSGQTWAGRGVAPKWFTDHVAAGGRESELRIPDPEGAA